MKDFGFPYHDMITNAIRLFCNGICVREDDGWKNYCTVNEHIKVKVVFVFN
jgi:hypothetical protein